MEAHYQMMQILYGILGLTTIIVLLMVWKAIDDCKKMKLRRVRRKEQRDAKYRAGIAAFERDNPPIQSSDSCAWLGSSFNRDNIPEFKRGRQEHAVAA